MMADVGAAQRKTKKRRVSPYGSISKIATIMSDDSSWLAPVGPPVSGLMAG
jgi:hypothetical protein